MIRIQLFKARRQPQLETPLRLHAQTPAPHYSLSVVLSGVFTRGSDAGCIFWVKIKRQAHLPNTKEGFFGL